MIRVEMISSSYQVVIGGYLSVIFRPVWKVINQILPKSVTRPDPEAAVRLYGPQSMTS